MECMDDKMAVKKFQIRGKFRMGDEMQPFVKECTSDSEEHAVEKIYSELGSKHKTPRNRIRIEEVVELRE